MVNHACLTLPFPVMHIQVGCQPPHETWIYITCRDGYPNGAEVIEAMWSENGRAGGVELIIWATQELL